ncbi:MAG: putative Alpha-methylacyl-CoA racemase, partial [Acidimicrobiia bacterium]|nr:putative Alpha-methylacyl-CoA racemase [Acidimicrobiia bacterium]
MGPLDGLRVVDLSPLRAGVQASQLLADFGAEVIWIEPPGGAPLREHVSFPMWGRGKQSLELNLHQPADVQRLRQLVATADVLIESFRPGVMERLGLSYESLAPLNPRLVYASITGFGRHGPYAGIKAYEGVVMAKLGVFGAFNRLTDTPGPPFVTTQYASFSASQTALHGILAALFEREHSGLGQRVDTSMAMGFAALDTWQWFMHLVTSRWPGAFAPAAVFDENGSPVGPYPFMLLIALTSDGHWLQFAQVAPHLYKALMTALGLEWMYEDPKWKGIPFLDDSDKREELWANMLAAARKLSLAQWEEIFESNTDVFAEVFRDGPNVLDHPQLVHDGHVMELVDPDRGPVRQPAGILQMDGTPLTIDRPAPRVGEHHPDLDLDALPEPPMSKVADGPRRLPLEGITIVELAVQYAAPYGATLLTDLGARVLKIEALEGDPIRNMMPMPESSGAKVMQGKESVTVDLGSPEGVAIVQQLAAKADVVLQGFRAGVVKRLGLDSETLQALNPKLVYVNAPGYGIGPPNGHRPAFAPSIAAAGGMARANVGNAVPESSELDTEQVRRGSRVLSAGGTVTNAQADGFAALAVA